ncbi:MAG: GNAT family N-acetyltransferase [Endozoicomonas sp.]
MRNEARGKGIGRQLLNDMVEAFASNKVDVNEQNQQAVGFYEHCGFRVKYRSPLDGMGKPFPILNMSL